MKKETKETEIAEFNIADLLPIAMVFVVLIIGLAIGLQIVGSIRTNASMTGCADRTDGFTTTTAAGLCANSSGDTTAPTSIQYNATGTGLSAINIFVSNLGTIALVVIAAVIIGILFRYMMGGAVGGARIK